MVGQKKLDCYWQLIQPSRIFYCNSMLSIFFGTANTLAYFASQIVVYEKTTCQYQMKFITKEYCQMYKTLYLFTNTFTFNINNFASIKVIKKHWHRVI
jgi:hypothetical protein